MNSILRKSWFYICIIIATALASSAITWAMLHYRGYHFFHGISIEKPSDDTKSEQKQLWTCGMHPWIVTEEPGLCPICNMDLTPKREDKTVVSGTGSERKILYWRAPMNSSEIYDKPGKSAMGMDLIPVYEDEVVGGVRISIDPVTIQNMGIRTVAVKKARLSRNIRTYGHITYDETRTAQISSKVSGWFEKLHVNFTGEQVKKGQPLFDIYSPDLVAAQEEYLTAVRNFRYSDNIANREMIASAYRRLTFFDVAESEIDAIEKNNEVRKTVMIRSPFDGVVTHKNAVQGGFVKAGSTVYTIADLSRVWVEAHIYEYELGWVRQGLDVQMTLPYQPGKIYRGKVVYVYPYLQQKTRDVVIRVEFENPDMELKPDMYADIRIDVEGTDQGLIIPSQAVIRSGERNVVFVSEGNGTFSPRETTIGMSLNHGNVQILSGLAPGENVVVSGQFLLDSESKLQETIQKMMAAEAPPARDAQTPDERAGNAFFDDMASSGNDFFNDM